MSVVYAKLSAMETTELVGTREACLILDVTMASVRNLTHAGRLKPVGRIGKRGTFIYRKSDVEALAEKRAEEFYRRHGE